MRLRLKGRCTAMELEKAAELVQMEVQKRRRMAELDRLSGNEMMAAHRDSVADALETVLRAALLNARPMLKITIPGPPVTKKNSQRIIRLGNGRYSIHPSKAFEAYQKSAGIFIPGTLRRSLSGRYNVKCEYFMPTRRRVDLVNLLEATCDILVHYHVLEDDHSGVVASHDGSRVVYDKERPRVEIEISEVRRDYE
ncbi:MAG: holliday junction resolvase [Caudoviricetes sp.]|nr:MAG: holliday junction resolvase [Caudoviricetes sp.]